MSSQKIIQGLEEAVRHATRPNTPDTPAYPGSWLEADIQGRVHHEDVLGQIVDTGDEVEAPPPPPNRSLDSPRLDDLPTMPETQILLNIENDVQSILNVLVPIIDSLLLIIKSLIGDTDAVEKLKNYKKQLEDYQRGRMLGL